MARQKGEKARNVDSPVELAVDIAKLCPDGMTAKNFGAMYATEFVQRCLEAGNVTPSTTPTVIRNTAADIAGNLYYLILSAKGKKRKAIMKSRKPLVEGTYGKSPSMFEGMLR